MNNVTIDQNKIILTSEENPDDDLTIIAGKKGFYIEVCQLHGEYGDEEIPENASLTLNKGQMNALADWISEKLKGK